MPKTTEETIEIMTLASGVVSTTSWEAFHAAVSRGEMDPAAEIHASDSELQKNHVGQPFSAGGRLVQYVDVQGLATFLPFSTDTLRDWEKRGKIPAIRLPPVNHGGKDRVLFDLYAVQKTLEAYGRSAV